MSNLKILFIGNYLIIQDDFDKFLSENHFEVFKAASYEEVIVLIKNNEIDIAMLEVELPDKNGMLVLQEIKTSYPDMDVIMLAESGNFEMVLKAMRLGAQNFLIKPLLPSDIEDAIKRCRKYLSYSFHLKESNRNNELLIKELKTIFKWELIVESKGMKEVLNLAAKVAKTDKTTVLITGESGTGKELIANSIHLLSQRKNHFFNAVNCSAIPETLFESEFFGHKKGSFTDAIETKSGLFEVCNKGTLFLDEIGDLKYELQGKFLRVLEEGKITKIGSSEVIDVDVRLIAATNKDLRKQCENGKFRIDLLHRLNSFVINLPPLRERREAIPSLLNYYLHLFAMQFNKKIQGIEPNTIQILTDYSFPGNIRELRNMVERAVILCDDAFLKLKHFQFNYTNNNYRQNTESTNRNLNLAENERVLILNALKETQHNKSRAAQLLGIDRKRLLRKINLYSIQ